jgi:hypothetical protein
MCSGGFKGKHYREESLQVGRKKVAGRGEGKLWRRGSRGGEDLGGKGAMCRCLRSSFHVNHCETSGAHAEGFGASDKMLHRKRGKHI